MTHHTMSYLAIVFKVAITLVGIVVVWVAVAISRRRHRKEQSRIDDAIVGKSSSDPD